MHTRTARQQRRWRGSPVTIAGVFAALALTAALAAPGDLDPSFGTGGKVLTQLGVGAQSFNMALQSDGKVLVVGEASNGSNPDFALARYNTDGSLDSSFGSGGKVVTPIGSLQDYGYGVAVQADGKILACGASDSGGGDWDFALVRYNTDGSLDSSFGSSGKVVTAVGSSNDYALNVAVQSDGKIVVGGYSNVDGGFDFAVTRYLADGSLDGTFGSGGKVFTAIGNSHDYGYSLKVQPDGKIVQGGFGINPASGGNNDFALVRYNTDGGLDSTFSGDGKVFVPVGSGSDYAYSVALQPDGKILLGGYSTIGGNDDFALIRVNSDGSLDGTFGSSGKVLTDLGTNQDYGISVALQSDGKIFLSGMGFNGTNTDFALVRYNANGSLDGTFGSGGTVLTDVGGGDDTGTRMAVQTDGKPVLAGWSRTDRDYFSVVRYGVGAAVDNTPPACTIGTPVSAGGQVYVPVTVTDAGSGVARVQLTASSSNVHLESPLGTTVPSNDLALAPPQGSRIVYAVKDNPAAKAVVGLRVTDAAGNVALCDPIVANLELKKGRSLERTFSRIPANEHYLTLQNGSPGLTRVTLWVNGRIVSRGQLTDGQTVNLDVQAAMRRGRSNTVHVVAAGPQGATAILAIGDMPMTAPAAGQRTGAALNLEFTP